MITRTMIAGDTTVTMNSKELATRKRDKKKMKMIETEMNKLKNLRPAREPRKLPPVLEDKRAVGNEENWMI